MKGFVYILKDQAGKFYVGSTTDIKRRLRQHGGGYTQTTRNMIQPQLVLVQEYETLDKARKIERKIKNLKRHDYIQEMVEDGLIKMSI